jgi:hypothetical protein
MDFEIGGIAGCFSEISCMYRHVENLAGKMWQACFMGI